MYGGGKSPFIPFAHGAADMEVEGDSGAPPKAAFVELSVMRNLGLSGTVPMTIGKEQRIQEPTLNFKR